MRPSDTEPLALAGPSGQRSTPPRGPTAGGRQRGVLVVDDQDYIRDMLGAALRSQGFTVWLAADGREALELYRHHRAAIDLALLDVRMPGLDGPGTLAALRAMNPRVCCCFLSGDLGGYTEEGLRGLGAALVVRKPVKLEDLERVALQLTVGA